MLTKINFTIFSFLFLGGCAYNPIHFLNERLEPVEEANIGKENQTVRGKFQNSLGPQFFSANPKIFYLMGEEQKKGRVVPRNFVLEYVREARKYFKLLRLSVPRDFREKIKRIADELYESDAPNILFNLATYVIDAIIMLENDQFLLPEEKQRRAQEIIQANYDAIDHLVMRALDLPESPEDPNENKFFSFQEIVAATRNNERECYHFLADKSSIPDVCFSFLIGPAPRAIEILLIKGRNRLTDIPIGTVKEFFDGWQDEIDDNKYTTGLFKARDRWEDFFTVNAQKVVNVVNKAFILEEGAANKKTVSFHTFKGEDYLFTLKQNRAPLREVIDSIQQLLENAEYFIDFKIVFLIKRNGTLSFQQNQKLFVVKEERNPKNEIISAEMTYVPENLNINLNKFRLGDEALRNIIGFGQTDILDTVQERCNDIYTNHSPCASPFLKTESYSFVKNSFGSLNDIVTAVTQVAM
ncbi:MAG: hypothetical protein LBD32_01535 [Cytophagales bacterium]|jgi:hypothetical protein|nr:hypothetical protein [Cytophagales bacterium]